MADQPLPPLFPLCVCGSCSPFLCFSFFKWWLPLHILWVLLHSQIAPEETLSSYCMYIFWGGLYFFLLFPNFVSFHGHDLPSLRVHSQEVSRLHMLLWRATVGTREILPKAMGNLPLLAHNIPKGPGTILQGHWTVLKMTLLIISKLSFYQCSHCNKDWDNKVVPEAMWPFRWFTN